MRENEVDLEAEAKLKAQGKKYTKNPAPPKNPHFEDPKFKEWQPVSAPPAEPSNPFHTANPSSNAGKWEQLELNFDKNATSGAAIAKEEAALAKVTNIKGWKAIKYGGKVVGFVAETAGKAIILYYVGKRFFLMGTNIREGKYGEAFMQGFYLLEDLSPVPSARPEKISFHDLGDDQSWAKDNTSFTGTKSGCEVCHESVRIENYIKSSGLWQYEFGPISKGGIITDKAREFWLNSIK